MKRGLIVTGYKPKPGFPTDQKGNLLLDYTYGPAPKSESQIPSVQRSERIRRGGVPKQGELL